MNIVGSFVYSSDLELAISKLEEKGINHNHITAIPLDKRVEEARLFDTIHQSDSTSLVDLAAVFGMIFLLLGTIYGFVLTWGPILWGMIGLAFGLILGFLIDYYTTKKKRRTLSKKANGKQKTSEVILVVKCEEKERKIVERVLWDHFALGVGRVDS